MAHYEFKVVPFIGKIKSSESAEAVGRQLEALIASGTSGGWEFYQLSDVNIQVSPGCLAGLLGSKESYIRFDQIIFRRYVE